MNVIDRFARVVDTGLHKPRFAAVSTLQQTGDIRPSTLDRNTEYELTLTLKQTFWANKAQLPEATDRAKRALNAQLYADILCHIPALLSAAHGQDCDEVVRIASAIQSALGN